ncbi:hypothetical protein [Amedibacillus sp. YH-ame10]
MKKTIEVVLQKENNIILDQSTVEKLGIKTGDVIELQHSEESLGKCCFTIETSMNEDQELQEGYYCIPMHLLKKVGLDEENVHLLINDEEIILTSANNIISGFPPELIEAMIEQGVSLDILVEDIVERLNENVLEKIED